MKYLDDSWERNEHFNFFQSRKNPCFSVSFSANVAQLCVVKKQHGFRFTDCIYFAAMLAANSVAGFRQRIVNLRPAEFDSIDAAFTYIPKGRALHCNCVAKFDKKFSAFSSNITAARTVADQAPTLYPEGGDAQSLIYFSCVPDIPILSATNPWGDPWVDTVPRFLFGKIDSSGNITVSIEALHSFIDGIHLAEFYKLFTQVLESPHEYFG
ncbi:chloramphenicol acetyltransferase [Desulfovibrio desulfuricans]|uniref:Chloramphenicol acetyltransferase n=1 Tax=Desulfovibrio desulfuricans TaxID=876 RepID=A0A4P7UEZ1_DESDE|nr:CatA-like O-acetyltransferase [Desulfovibrio desulfuricans]QCC84383.1 chloramphenicol acetyltransferase [Desulfovibrio desulfuricans]